MYFFTEAEGTMSSGTKVDKWLSSFVFFLSKIYGRYLNLYGCVISVHKLIKCIMSVHKLILDLILVQTDHVSSS